MNELVVEREHEPADDTNDRVRRAVAILLADEPCERDGEVTAMSETRYGGVVFKAPTPDGKFHIIEDASVEKKYSLCRLVLDVADEQVVLEVGDGAWCRSCVEEARRRGYR